MAPVLLTAGALLGAVVFSSGCAGVGRGRRSELQVQAAQQALVLSPEFTTVVYLPIDGNTADVYLSDLPEELLRHPAADLGSITGSIVHVHLFLVPRAGRTPIDSSACNFTMRHLVLAGGGNGAGSSSQVGLYSGGGFLLPDRAPGKRVFSGSVRDATVRLQASTNGFADRLGVGTVTGSITARRDPELARAMAAKIEAIAGTLPRPAAEAGREGN